MKKNVKILLSMGLSLALAVTAVSFLGDGTIAHATSSDKITVTDDDINALCAKESFTRGSVHDPSVVNDGNGTYYVFGSHMGVAKTTDLMNWTSVTSESETSPLFGTYDASGNLNTVSYNQAFRKSAYVGQVTTNINGVTTQQNFGTYDASAWNTALGDYKVSGNMWAPDVLYNKSMQKWCMYLSLNGKTWNSAIILLTADNINGPYVYQGPVLYTGFSNTNAALSYKNTDLELVYGKLDSLPEKYDKADSGKWGDYWPHAIDPCVFYDENGNLVMSYGSWSGGIYELQLDKNTGLRDYTVNYKSDFDGTSKTINTDAYYGTKIAGGYYVSGEGSYIRHIGDYYYLFLSYGFYSPEGGYNMRIFRSKNPDGPFLDTKGTDARYSSFSLNYNADWGTIQNYEGERLMTNYKWDTMDVAECSQGHNSEFTDKDGRSFAVYHTKFDDGTTAHELRIHELFQDENGWLLASPYEYTADNKAINYQAGVNGSDVVGNYQMIVNSYEIGYDATAANKIAVATPKDLSINADGTISGTYTGTWKIKDGTPYCTLQMNGASYTGVFVKQTIDKIGISTMCFSVLDEASGLTIWGSQKLSGEKAIALNVEKNTVDLPDITYGNVTLPSQGLNDTAITWSSSKNDVIAFDGTFHAPAKDTDVTLTMTMTNGNYSYLKNFKITAKAAQADKTFLLASYFKDKATDLSKYADGTLTFNNPYYKNTSNGLDISKGVTFTFDATPNGAVHVLGTIFSLQGNGRLYFTPGSYLGYNATGGWYDANLNNYTLVKDYIGNSAHVVIQLKPDGYLVSVNGQTAYTQATLDSSAKAGTLTDYTKVLEWLAGSAKTLTFGSGSWWSDTANCSISNMNCYVGLDVDNADKNLIYVDGKKVETSDILANAITLNQQSLSLKEVEKATLAAVLSPANATEQVTFISEKPEVAAVDLNTGVVTAVKHGTTKITASTKSGLSATCSIKIEKAATKDYKLNKTKLKLAVGETYSLKANFKMADQSEPCTFASSDSSLVSISSDGLVTALKTGNAVITVTSQSGIEKTCTVRVK